MVLGMVLTGFEFHGVLRFQQATIWRTEYSSLKAINPVRLTGLILERIVKNLHFGYNHAV